MREKKGEPRKSVPEDRHSCEFCLCATCEKTCTRCARCSPMKHRYIPLIGCKEFIDMRRLRPLRYLYYSGAVEYKLHLKLP
ncbi:MAG: hypothetical protein JW958_06385 [Candidatus Eisenbacteria bacterium]|nr:hypothetical protein [Candidatus Eisenbacteria bacterium]